MSIGKMSASLAVSDLAASRAFYETLGFEVAFGDASAGWLVMKDGANEIGLFQDMFEANFTTFSVDPNAPDFPGLDALQDRIEAAGVEIVERCEGPGPGFFLVHDPDGNQIHVAHHSE